MISVAFYYPFKEGKKMPQTSHVEHATYQSAFSRQCVSTTAQIFKPFGDGWVIVYTQLKL